MESPARAAPRSAQHFGICLAALAAALFALWAFPPSRVLSWTALRGLYLPIVPCLVVAAALVLGDVVWLRAGLRASTGYAPRPLRARALPDVVFRLVGLGVTLGLLGFVYWLVPEYQGTFYTPFWRFLKTVGPPFLVLAPFYFLWADPRMIEPRDAYWQLGRLVSTFSTADCDAATLRLHFLGWGVKGFFLPLMVVFLDDRYYGLELSYRSLQPELMHVYTFVYDLTYALDVLFCVVGYTLTVRLFDSHMRSVEPTVRGWLVAIACYDPFYGLVLGARYFHYDDRLFWDNWLGAQPGLRMVWAIVILVLLSVYTLSTIAFGLRFSNLTHRGIITNGPYRWSKHPAYLSKNLSWWLISVPFIPAGDALDAVRNCGLLLALNALYYLRARTEEWHLSRDPDYVAYAEWMDAHGPLRVLGRIFPFLRYRRPATQVRSAAGVIGR